jgi:hypothetical protein
VETIATMGAQSLAFVVHVGDMKAGGNSRCTDALFEKRKAQFNASTHPFILTPGDNDWTDCRRKSNGADDPIERLNAIRRIFFSDGNSLGASRIPTEPQLTCLEAGSPCHCGPFPENRLWESGSVVFATINVQGSNNNRGFDAVNDREADCRDRANLAWLAEAERRTTRERALVVFTQGNLWDADAPTYRIYVDALVDIAARLRKPVLFVHGDTHRFRYDTPFTARDGSTVANPSRLEVYGSPFVGWVKVDVDVSRPEPFTVYPHLTAFVPPHF